jgi:hypothetical protein
VRIIHTDGTASQTIPEQRCPGAAPWLCARKNRTISADARTGDRFDGEAPVFEEGVEHAPREGAVGAAALEGERHGLFGARPGEAAGLARMASSAARHRAAPLEVPDEPCLGH